MSQECEHCKAELEPENFPFGDEVTCQHCGTVHDTEWDYVSEDSMAWWTTGIARFGPKPNAEEPTNG